MIRVRQARLRAAHCVLQEFVVEHLEPLEGGRREVGSTKCCLDLRTETAGAYRCLGRCCSGDRLGPVAIEGQVLAVAGEQLVVRALLYNEPVLEHDDRVRLADGQRRCAITKAVLPASNVPRASSMRRSVAMSTLDVASSRIRIRGSGEGRARTR